MENRKSAISFWLIIIFFTGCIGFFLWNIAVNVFAPENQLEKIWRERENQVSISPPLSYAEIFQNADYLASLQVTAEGPGEDGATEKGIFLFSGFINDWDSAYGKYTVMTAGHIDIGIPEVRITKIEVIFKNGQGPEEMEVANIHQGHDAAVLIFKNKKFKFYGQLPKRGNSDLVQVGDPIVALGAPHGIKNYFSFGYIGRNDLDFTELHLAGFHTTHLSCGLFAHSASTNPGCSGGPLFNIRGEIIGVHSMLIGTPDPERSNWSSISIAIPINSAVAVLQKP